MIGLRAAVTEFSSAALALAYSVSQISLSPFPNDEPKLFLQGFSGTGQEINAS